MVAHQSPCICPGGTSAASAGPAWLRHCDRRAAAREKRPFANPAVLADAQAIPIHAAELEERQREVLVGGRLQPSLGLGKVLRHAQPAETQEAQIVLAAGISPRRLRAETTAALRQDPVDTVTLGVVAANPIHRVGNTSGPPPGGTI